MEDRSEDRNRISTGGKRGISIPGEGTGRPKRKVWSLSGHCPGDGRVGEKKGGNPRGLAGEKGRG